LLTAIEYDGLLNEITAFINELSTRVKHGNDYFINQSINKYIFYIQDEILKLNQKNK